jgi:hypothetical protein
MSQCMDSAYRAGMCTHLDYQSERRRRRHWRRSVDERRLDNAQAKRWFRARKPIRKGAESTELIQKGSSWKTRAAYSRMYAMLESSQVMHMFNHV